jgi:hypothetical protein
LAWTLGRRVTSTSLRGLPDELVQGVGINGLASRAVFARFSVSGLRPFLTAAIVAPGNEPGGARVHRRSFPSVMRDRVLPNVA